MNLKNIQDPSSPNRDLFLLERSSWIRLFMILLLIILQWSLRAQPPTRVKTTIEASLRNQVEQTIRASSRKFQIIPNSGQEGLPTSVLGYFTTDRSFVFIQHDRLRVIILETIEAESHTPNVDGARFIAGPSEIKYRFFDLVFEGSSPFSELEQKHPFETRRNYLHTVGGSNAVPSYGEWVLKNVYPGIDIRLYSQQQGHLEFDWILWPGADPGKIQMRFEGNSDLALTENGALRVGLGNGHYDMNLPESYSVLPSGKKAVDVRFQLKGTDAVEFQIKDTYDLSQPLVIDPDLIWGIFFDGASASFDEYLYAIEKNPVSELIYCAGAANLQVSTVYAASLSGAYDGTFSSNPDAFIYALTPDGQTVKYATYLGGTGSDIAIGLAVYDTAVFVTGYTASSAFPVTDNAWDNSYGGSIDGFITVLNDSLNRIVYSSFLGASGTDYAYTVRATGADAFVISLQVSAALPIVSPQNYLLGAADATFGGSNEAWIGRFYNYNQLSFGTYVGGSDVDQINDFQVLSTGSILFVGYTKSIAEVNASITHNNNTRTDALFGRIDVREGQAIFQYIEKFGGTNTDNAWGITCLGDSISIVVGQTTSSTGFPLGTGTPFQAVNGGGTEAFIARFNNNGGGYKASYVGGSGTDILVAVRPIILGGRVVLMSFGTTTSTNLLVNNYNAGTLYSPTNGGGQDMMFLICDQQLEAKYYLSYIGGSANDYLGKTGVPWGSNHMYYDSTKFVLYVGTTTHSLETTHNTRFVGRNPIYAPYQGLPIFDAVKSNGSNDAHLVFAIEIRSFIISVLASEWMDLKVHANAACKPVLTWSTSDEMDVSSFEIQRSYDGIHFHTIQTLDDNAYSSPFTDNQIDPQMNQAIYRIMANSHKGTQYFSDDRLFRTCKKNRPGFEVYPTWVKDHITIRDDGGRVRRTLRVVMINELGVRVQQWDFHTGEGPQVLTFNRPLSKGTYYLIIQDSERGDLLHRSRLIAMK